MASPGLLAQLDDKTLIDRSRNGDREAFGELYSRHFQQMWRTAMKFLRDSGTADDLVQETFARAIARIDQFRGDGKLTTWLTSILVRLCIERGRRSGRERAMSDSAQSGQDSSGSVLDLAESEEPAPEHRMQAVEREAAVRDAIAGLGENERIAVMLFYIQKRSYKEIAEETGWPMGTVMTRLHRARLQLAEVLTGFQDSV